MNGKVDVLEVMQAMEQLQYMSGIGVHGATEARAAVAELIDAIDAERKGQYHDSEVEFRINYDARRYQEKRRVDAALARVKGE